MAISAKKKAIDAVMKATGQTEAQVLASNPKLADQPAVAASKPRGAGSAISRPVPAGISDPWG
jgi:glycine cleavage system H lipoate-binding protein